MIPVIALANRVSTRPTDRDPVSFNIATGSSCIAYRVMTNVINMQAQTTSRKCQ